MLLDISKYTHLGTSNQLSNLIGKVLSVEPKRITDIESFCALNSGYQYQPVKGVLATLKYIDVINHSGEYINLNENGKKIKTKFTLGKDILSDIVKLLLHAMLNDGTLNYFFDIENIKYDTTIDRYIIRNSAIPLKYANVRNLLLNLDFFAADLINPNLLYISKSFVGILRCVLSKLRPLMSIEEMKSKQLKNELEGKEAEQYVLKFELKRLISHSLLSRIKRVSDIDVNAGFDILSFESISSCSYDRFIEVKSYIGQPGFFWSSNEIQRAKEKQELYYLYLVNRKFMNLPDYEPTIICNPYIEVFENEKWEREAQIWYISIP